MDTVHSLGGPQCVKCGGTEAAEERNTWNQVTQAPCHTSGFALFKTSGRAALQMVRLEKFCLNIDLDRTIEK